MTPENDLWEKIWEQADAWSETPVSAAFQEQLPRNASQRSTGVPGVLQDLHAGSPSAMTHPLRYSSIIPPLLATNLVFRRAERDSDLDKWLTAAGRLESAHRMTIAWFRSRLPDYPMIKAPQLCPNTPFTTPEWTFQLIWTIDERRQGLQFQPNPPDVSGLLGASGEVRTRLTSTAHAVATALARTEQWLSFKRAAESLDDSAKAELAGARKHLRQALSPASVDAHEPVLMLERGKYLALTMTDAINSLTGTARCYADAFTQVNKLIDNVASEVFGQLVSFGEPAQLPVSTLDFSGGSPARVRFEIPDQYLFAVDCGSVAWLDDPLVADAVKIEAISSSLHSTGDATLKIGAVILDGTGDGWLPSRR